MKISGEFTIGKINSDTLLFSLGKNENLFRARLMLNANDAMVFAQIDEYPADSALRIKALQAFRELLYTQYGAKTFLEIDPHFYQDALKAGFNSKPFIGPANREITNALMITSKKLGQALQAFRFHSKPDLQLLKNTELQGRGAELFEFKKANADFVTQDKIDRGLYSADAEEKKLLNPNNIVFALADNNNKIVATLMLTIQGRWVYGADFIVNKQLQQKGVAKYLCLTAHQELSNILPLAFVNVWLIGGGHEEDSLYQKLFGAEPINEKSQAENGIFVFFTQPGDALKAAISETAKQRYEQAQSSVTKKIGFLASYPLEPINIADCPKIERLSQ